MVVLMMTNNCSATLNFRKPLIDYFKSVGCEVHLIVFDDTRLSEIEALGVCAHYVPFSNQSLSPFALARTIRSCRKIADSIRPKLILTFQIMPNVIGGFLTNVDAPFIGMVEGRGNVFSKKSLKDRLIYQAASVLLKLSLRKAKSVYFLNSSDKTFFTEKKIVSSNQAKIISGIGLDVRKFPFSKITNFNHILMISRLVKAKGVVDFCEAAELVKKINENIIFDLYGPEGDIKICDLEKYLNKGSVVYHGPTKSPFLAYESCTLLCLPSSYGEGLPMTIMEAACVGRASLVYPFPGSECAVLDGETGYICSSGTPRELADKILYLFDHKEEAIRMGENACTRAKSIWPFSIAEKIYLEETTECLFEKDK